MDKFLIKNIIILSLIFGLIPGTLASVPFLGLLMLIIVVIFSAPIIMLYLIMDGKLELTTPKDSIITGALIGFCTNITFAAAYCIMIAMLAVFFQYSPNFVLTAMITNSPIWLIGVFVVFVSVLSATTNAFSGFATYYIINFIRDMYEKQNPEITQNKDYYRNKNSKGI